jgi:tetratricopeptide (TPR) repeat protein
LNNELQHISRRLTGLSMKRSGLAFGIYGEPGIGKTHATLALLRGTPCQTRTVHATQALEKIFLQLPRPKKLSLWLEKFLERLTKGATLETELLNQSLVALLAANAPIILHVEDLHEASSERLEFWQKLALGVVRTQGVGLIVTSRVRPPESFEAIRLSALTREESDVLLETEANTKLPAEALAWLFLRAAGNPLFTLEFFRFLARQGSLWNDGQRWRFRNPERETIPITVEALIEQMLRDTASSPMLENAIGAKAMLGLGTSDNLWAEVAGLTLENLNALKTELEQQGVLSNGEFVHPLFREVIAHGLQPEQRQRFARRALEVLKDDPRVAAEFAKDAELEPEQTLALLQQAAQSSKDAMNHVQAASFLARAVQYANRQEKGSMALEAARGLRDFNLVQATQLAKIASDVLLEKTDALNLLVELLAIQGQISEAEQTLDRLPAVLQKGSVWLSRQLRVKSIMRDYTGVLTLWDAHPELHSQLELDLAGEIAFALASKNRNDEARMIATEALANETCSSNLQIRLVNVLGVLSALQGDFVSAEHFFAEVVKLVRQVGLIQGIGSALINHASALRCLGRYQEMNTEQQEAMRLLSEVGAGKSYANCQSLFGKQLIEFGRYEQAEEELLTSLKHFQQGVIDDFIIHCEGSLSILYQDWELPQGAILALKYANSALRHARSLGAPSRLAEALSYAATTEVYGGNAKKGLALAEEELEIARRIAQPEAIFSAQHARGMALFALGQAEEALEAFREAEELAIKMGLSLEHHKIGLEIDRLTSNLNSARARMAWFAERGLMNGVNIALRYFPALNPNTSTLPPSSNIEITSMPHLEVLGSMQITLEGQTTPVRGRKRQELLALLLEARISGRSEVSKLELVDKLYPDADEIQANTGIYDVVYQLRSSLGESTLTTTANGYALGNLKTDVETFLETGNTKLWRGVYLEGLLLEGSDTVRESVYLALRTRAEALLETDPSEVTRVGRLLCEADPYDLEALRLTVTGLRALQNHRSLSRFYDSARTRFLEIGEVLPARWQDFLTQIGTTA